MDEGQTYGLSLQGYSEGSSGFKDYNVGGCTRWLPKMFQTTVQLYKH